VDAVKELGLVGVGTGVGVGTLVGVGVGAFAVYLKEGVQVTALGLLSTNVRVCTPDAAEGAVNVHASLYV
jgi:hypothetical protein